MRSMVLLVCSTGVRQTVRVNGLVGLGAMGFPMAAQIRRKMPASSTFCIYDIHRPSCENFISQFSKFGSIVVADSPAEVAEGAQAVVSILPDADIVRQVYLNTQHGVSAASTDPNRLLLECSTISPTQAREVAAATKELKAGYYVDCPVSVSYG